VKAGGGRLGDREHPRGDLGRVRQKRGVRHHRQPTAGAGLRRLEFW
jgi:hypothetical protein